MEVTPTTSSHSSVEYKEEVIIDAFGMGLTMKVDENNGTLKEFIILTF
jgi:hypothetical protein